MESDRPRMPSETRPVLRRATRWPGSKNVRFALDRAHSDPDARERHDPIRLAASRGRRDEGEGTISLIEISPTVSRSTAARGSSSAGPPDRLEAAYRSLLPPSRRSSELELPQLG